MGTLVIDSKGGIHRVEREDVPVNVIVPEEYLKVAARMMREHIDLSEDEGYTVSDEDKDALRYINNLLQD